MAIYLIKDSPTQSIDDVTCWSPAELKKAEEVLINAGFEYEFGQVYSKNQATVGLHQARITIDHKLAKTDIPLRLITELNPRYFLNEKSELHIMSDLNK